MYSSASADVSDGHVVMENSTANNQTEMADNDEIHILQDTYDKNGKKLSRKQKRDKTQSILIDISVIVRLSQVSKFCDNVFVPYTSCCIVFFRVCVRVH